MPDFLNQFAAEGFGKRFADLWKFESLAKNLQTFGFEYFWIR